MVMSRRRRAGLFMKINDLGPDAPRPTADSFRAILPCANRGRTDVYRPDDNIGTRGCTRCRGATQEAFHRRLSLSALPASHGRGLRCRHRGMNSAHELALRGWRVTVIKSNPDAGGFFRSARMHGDGNMPSEYSWLGMGPWYHNLFYLLKQIPFDDAGSMYEKALCRPIDFGVAPDAGIAQCRRQRGLPPRGPAGCAGPGSPP